MIVAYNYSSKIGNSKKEEIKHAFYDQNMLRYFGKYFSENHGLLCQLFAISKTKLSPNLYDFAFVGNRKRQILDRAHFLEFSFPQQRTLFNTIRHSLHSGFSNISGYHYHSIYPFSHWLPSNTVLYWDRIRGHLRAF